MKIKCVHGYFFFEESAPGELSRFVSRFGLNLESSDDHVTFTKLVDAPSHSIKNAKYFEATAIKNFEGKPWEVLRANGLVYNFQTDTIVTLSSIGEVVSLKQGSNYFLANGLILPGSLTDEGDRVTDYVAWYSFADASFRYSEVTRV
jgi:hypothetical protein